MFDYTLINRYDYVMNGRTFEHRKSSVTFSKIEMFWERERKPWLRKSTVSSSYIMSVKAIRYALQFFIFRWYAYTLRSSRIIFFFVFREFLWNNAIFKWRRYDIENHFFFSMIFLMKLVFKHRQINMDYCM